MLQTYQSTAIRRFGIATLFLTAVIGLVHSLPLLATPLEAEKEVNRKTNQLAEPPEILRDFKILPPQVARMQQAILVAALSGEIDAMRVPIEMNEIPPIIAQHKVSNPITHWKNVSADGKGREILAILIQLFRTGFLQKAQGTDDTLYIWPYFVETPMDKLTPSQEVELLTLVTPRRLEAMKASGTYDYYRLSIAHDGTWHEFVGND